MNLVLENPELRQQISPMTLETYHALAEMDMIEERSELIEGYVLPKMPISPLHYFVVSELAAIFQSHLPLGWLLRSENPLTLQFSEPEPDIALVLGQRRDFAKKHPATAEVVVEVAYSSMTRDLTKAIIYARANIKEYWLVNADEEWIDLYTCPDQNGYGTTQRFLAGEAVNSTVVAGLSVKVSALFEAVG